MIMPFVQDDGGRAAAGYKGAAGDCVCRSITIATGKPYREVYARLARETGNQRASKRGKRAASASRGINTGRKWFKEYMREFGFTWTPRCRSAAAPRCTCGTVNFRWVGSSWL